jgi:pimeloyl-ACP methyl ester carboxylesterase
MMSARVWASVIPLLTDHHEVIAPTAAGHRGGLKPSDRVTISALTDEAERLLDARGLGGIHIAGNSMGGWIAIELARRGRALSVCAFSPAGCWTPGEGDETRASHRLLRTRRQVQLFAPVAPALLRFAHLRRLAMRDVAMHGERLTQDEVIGAIRDVASCEAADDMLHPSECIEPLDPLPCRITLAWSGNDRILPPHRHGATARERLPAAEYVVIPDVGHVAMIDNPRLCADIILETTEARSGP